METTVKDLSVSEFKELIASTVKETMEALYEDLEALSSENYLRSIKESREDFRNGKINSFQDAFDV